MTQPINDKFDFLPLSRLADFLYEFSASKQIDDTMLFENLFSATALEAVFKEYFASSTSKGVDRLNGFQFAMNAKNHLVTASEKCLKGQYRFSPFLEVLKTKGRDKNPRLIGIPTVRDRVVLHQLNKFLAAIYPERVPKNVASTYVRVISTDLMKRSPTETWICSTDIKTFYDSILRDRVPVHPPAIPIGQAQAAG